MRRSLGVLAFTMTGAALFAAPAGAQDYPSIDIPLDTVERGDEGSEQELATESVPGDAVGRECDVTAESENNHSVHPDSDLLVRSGNSEVVVPDVEGEARGVIEATGTLVLDTDVSVSIRFGPDKVFSGGLVVSVDCPNPPPPSTSTSTTLPPEPEEEEEPQPAPPARPVMEEPNFTG